MATCNKNSCHATDLAAIPQIWPPFHRFGRHTLDLAAMPQIWLPCHRCGYCAKDLAVIPLIRRAKDLAPVQQIFRLAAVP